VEVSMSLTDVNEKFSTDGQCAGLAFSVWVE
jgi:hypothetical protein